MLGKLKYLFNEFAQVKNSSIHSKGVFAKKDISNGTYIIEYVGDVLTKKQSAKIADEQILRHKKTGQKEGSVYIFELDKKHDINGNVWYNPARFLNHSCSPNCETINDEGHIWIHAIRDIKKGEELTYNYGYDIDDYEEHPCRCGSKNCVGHIAAEKHWPKLKKKKNTAKKGKK